MFCRKPEITPLGMTTLAWPYATFEDVVRIADRNKYDLKIPFGQFKMLEHYVGSSACIFFNVIVLLKIHPTDWWNVNHEFSDFETALLRQTMDDGVDMLVLMISGHLNKWYRLSTCKNRDIQEIVQEFDTVMSSTKIWGYVKKCNNGF